MLTPNLIAKPATVLITKVTIKGMKQAVQMFGPAQYAVAKAVADCVADGTIPAAEADDLVIVCGVFIHPDAEDNAKILKYQLRGHQALDPERAMKNQPDDRRDHRAEGYRQAPVRLSDGSASDRASVEDADTSIAERRTVCTADPTRSTAD